MKKTELLDWIVDNNLVDYFEEQNELCKKYSGDPLNTMCIDYDGDVFAFPTPIIGYNDATGEWNYNGSEFSAEATIKFFIGNIFHDNNKFIGIELNKDNSKIFCTPEQIMYHSNKRKEYFNSLKSCVSALLDGHTIIDSDETKIRFNEETQDFQYYWTTFGWNSFDVNTIITPWSFHSPKKVLWVGYEIHKKSKTVITVFRWINDHEEPVEENKNIKWIRTGDTDED